MRYFIFLLSLLLIFIGCKQNLVEPTNPIATDDPHHITKKTQTTGPSLPMQPTPAPFTLPEYHTIERFLYDPLTDNWYILGVSPATLHSMQQDFVFTAVMSADGDSAFIRALNNLEFHDFPSYICLDEDNWYVSRFITNYKMEVKDAEITAFQKQTGDTAWTVDYRYGKVYLMAVDNHQLYTVGLGNHYSTIICYNTQDGSILYGPLQFKKNIGFYGIGLTADQLLISGDILGQIVSGAPQTTKGDIFVVSYTRDLSVVNWAQQFGTEIYDTQGYLCLSNDQIVVAGNYWDFDNHGAVTRRPLLAGFSLTGEKLWQYREETNVEISVRDIYAYPIGEIYLSLSKSANGSVYKFDPTNFSFSLIEKQQYLWRLAIVNSRLYYNRADDDPTLYWKHLVSGLF